MRVDENRNSNPRLMLNKVLSLAAVITVAGQLHHNKLSPSIKSSNPSLCMPRVKQGLYIMSRIRAEGKADHRRAARLFHMNTPVISCASLPVKVWSRMEHASVQILYKCSRIVLPVRRLPLLHESAPSWMRVQKLQDWTLEDAPEAHRNPLRNLGGGDGTYGQAPQPG